MYCKIQDVYRSRCRSDRLQAVHRNTLNTLRVERNWKEDVRPFCSKTSREGVWGPLLWFLKKTALLWRQPLTKYVGHIMWLVPTEIWRSNRKISFNFAQQPFCTREGRGKAVKHGITLYLKHNQNFMSSLNPLLYPLAKNKFWNRNIFIIYVHIVNDIFVFCSYFL